MEKLATWKVKTGITTSVIEAGCLWLASIIEWDLRRVDLSRTKLAEIRLYGIKYEIRIQLLACSVLLRLPIVHGEVARDVFYLFFICLSVICISMWA